MRNNVLKVTAAVAFIFVVFCAYASTEAEARGKASSLANMKVKSWHTGDRLKLIENIDHIEPFFYTSSHVPDKEESEYILLTPEFSYKKPVSVAILPFSNDTGDESLSWLSNGIPESLISKFTTLGSIRLIDRGLITEITEQLGLSSSALADPGNALKVGKLLAAKIIVRGSYQERPNHVLKVMARFTDVETGTILKAIEESGSQKNLEALMEQISCRLALAIAPNTHLMARLEAKPRSRLNAALKSTIWPGWGDLPDRKAAGILMGILQLGTLVSSAVSHFYYVDKLDEYKDARERYMDAENFPSYSEYEAQQEIVISKHKKAVDSRKLRNILFLSAILGTRIIGAMESAIFVPRSAEGEKTVISSTQNGELMLSWRDSF